MNSSRLSALFNARGAPPPRALARRPHFVAVHSVASLGPQALLNARGAPPPRALARRPHFVAVHSVASLGPQALLNARGAPPPRALRAPRDSDYCLLTTAF